MNKTLTDVSNTVSAAVSKHAPEILMGIGIAGMLTSTILAVKATSKAIKKLDAKKKELEKEKLTFGETVKTVWKDYSPAVVTAGASVACLVGSGTVSGKRNAALLTAYKIAETAHKEYKEKVVEVIGEKKEAQVKEKLAEDKLAATPYNNQAVILTNNGNTLFLDYLSGQYFRSDIGKVEKTINDLNRRMYTDGYVSVNSYNIALGLECTQMGDYMGWNLDKGYITIDRKPGVSTNGEPCLVLYHTVDPVYGYSSYM